MASLCTRARPPARIALPPTNPGRLLTQLLRPTPAALAVTAYVELLRRSGAAIEPPSLPPFTPSLPPLPLPPPPDFNSPFDNDWSDYDGLVRGYLIRTSGYVDRRRYLSLSDGAFQFLDREWLPYVPNASEMESVMAGLTWDIDPPAGFDPPFNYVGGDFVFNNGYQFQELVPLETISGAGKGYDSWTGEDLSQYQYPDIVYRDLTIVGGVQKVQFPISPVSEDDLNYWQREVSQPNWNWIGTNPGANANINYVTNLSVVVYTNGNIPSAPTPSPFIPIICRGDQQMQCEARVLIPLLKEILNELRASVKGRNCGEQEERVLGRGIVGLSKLTQLSLSASCNGAIAAVPDYWQLRVGQRSQLVLLFAAKLPNGKYGPPNKPLSIPWYPASRVPHETAPPIKYLDRGNQMGIMVLPDNSKIIVNCKTQSEAQRVINAALSFIPSNRRPSSATKPKIGPRGGEPIKQERVYCRAAHFFSKGQKDMKPDWSVCFK